jgi:hypothetical protein
MWEILADRPGEKTYQELTAVLGKFGFAFLLGAVLSTPWTWNLMMDDISYGVWGSRVPSVLTEFINQFRFNMDFGRFYPVKYFVNILKWTYLPRSPLIFHLINFALLSAIMALLAARLKSSWFWLISLAAVFKPLLEIVSFNPIAEGWVCLFAAWAWTARKNVFWAFSLALLTALSKEPGVLIFFAFSAYFLAVDGKKAWKSSVGFFVTGIALIIFIVHVKDSGIYLQGYSVLSIQGIRDFAYSLARMGLGTLPFLFVFSTGFRRIQLSRDLVASLVFWSVFGLGYLYLVSPRGTGPYLQPPAALSIVMICVLIFENGFMDVLPTRKQTVAFVLLFLLSFGIGFGRWIYYVRGINASSEAFYSLAENPVPNLILINGEEAVSQGQIVLNEFHSLSKVFELNDQGIEEAARFDGVVVLLELTRYFPAAPSDKTKKLERVVGGWDRIVDHGSYRLYFKNTRQS